MFRKEEGEERSINDGVWSLSPHQNDGAAAHAQQLDAGAVQNAEPEGVLRRAEDVAVNELPARLLDGLFLVVLVIFGNVAAERADHNKGENAY